MTWDKFGSPIERATFRMLIGLIGYMIGYQMLDRDRMGELLEADAQATSDPAEAKFIRMVAAAIAEPDSATPDLRVIPGGLN